MVTFFRELVLFGVSESRRSSWGTGLFSPRSAHLFETTEVPTIFGYSTPLVPNLSYLAHRFAA